MGYNINMMQQSACLVLNPITVITTLLSYLHTSRPGSVFDSFNIKLTICLVGAGLFSVSWPIDVQLVVFFVPVSQWCC